MSGPRMSKSMRLDSTLSMSFIHSQVVNLRTSLYGLLEEVDALLTQINNAPGASADPPHDGASLGSEESRLVGPPV